MLESSMKISNFETNYINFKSSEYSSTVRSFNPKVSVIVPIYNQEKFLHKALDSLQAQTLKDVEFICINDGSTDKSLEIINKYAHNDKRFKVIDQPNVGTGQARNNGLKIAMGEYISFLDPDDWLESNALKELYSKAKTQNCDMIVFNFNKKNENGDTIVRYNIRDKFLKSFGIKENKNFNWKNIKSESLGGLYPASWNKFYKNDLVKKANLYFTNSCLGEDNIFVFGATLNANNIGYSDKYYYNYVIHSNSVLRSHSDKNFSIIKSLDSVHKLLTRLNLLPELKDEFDNHVFKTVTYFKQLTSSKSQFLKACNKKSYIKQNQLLQHNIKANSLVLTTIMSILKNKMKR